MKKLAVFSLAALSLGSIYAAEPQPPADSPRPLPDQMADGPSRGERKQIRMERKDWKNRPPMKGDRHPGPGREDRRGPGGPGGLGGPGKPSREAGHGEKLARELNLTPEQKEKAKDIMEAAKPKIEAVRQEGREKIKNVMDESLKDLRPLLTPEQVAVLDDLQKLRADKATLHAAQKSESPAKQKKSKDE